MSKIVHISWINPSQNVDRYPAVLEGLRIDQRIKQPAGEFFFVGTAEEAAELQARMEQHIPVKSYTALDEENNPLGHIVSEPEISVIDIP